MKRFVMAVALACVISVSALAGDMPTCGAPAPVPGDVPTVGMAATIVLTLIRLLPR